MKRALRWVRHVDAALRHLRRFLLPPELVVFEDATAPWLASALGVCCELGLTEVVESRRWSRLETLAGQVGVAEMPLRRLFRILTSHGYFEFGHSEEAVRHNRLSRALKPGRGGNFCRLQANSWYRDCFSADVVVGALKEQKIPFEARLERPFFDFIQGNEPDRSLFSGAMTEITRFCAPFIADSLALHSGERVLDVGGGSGEFCRRLKSHFPTVEFAVLDLESAGGEVEVARIAGSFFDELPTGFDHFLLKNVLHDWDDERAVHILQNCAQAARKEGRLSLIELVLPSGSSKAGISASDFCVDWNVYCTLGGLERTLPDYRKLLDRTGWEVTRFAYTPTPLCVIEARRK